MKLHLFRTNSYHNAAQYVLEKLKQVSARDLSCRHIVIVPDRASMSAEQLILDNIGGSFNIEVRTLRKYANEILPNISQKYLSKQAGIMVLTKIIFDNTDNLSCYKKGIHNNGFTESIYEIIAQFMYSRIKAKDIQPENFPSALKAKMQDIKLIYSHYEEYLTNGFVDSATRLEMLIDNISQSAKVKNSYFYFYDFESLTVQEQEIIKSLSVHSKGVYLAYCYDNDVYRGHLYLDDVNEAVAAIADKLGQDVEFEESAPTYQDDFTKQIGENIYSYRETNSMVIPPDKLTLAQTPTVTEEVECLAQDICDFVRSGNRYRDYYVICSDIAKYRYTIERVFANYDIPYFTDTMLKVADHPLSQFVIDYLNMVKNNYKQDSVLCFVKNFYFCENLTDIATTPPTAVYWFENYCLKYNVSYKFDKFELGKKDEKINFQDADSVRAKLYEIISAYPIDDSLTTREKIAVIKKMLDEQGGKEKSEKLAELCESNGETSFAAATRQICAKLNDILTQFENILGDTVLQADDFIRILQSGIDNTNVSVLPTRNDCVVLANMAKSRKHDIVALGLLGAMDNQMPIVKKDTKLLSDSNISLLSSRGLNLQCKMATENKREKFSLYQLLLEPRRHLFVSCCERQADDSLGNVLIPSEFFGKMAKIFTVDGGKYPVLNHPKKSTVYTADCAMSWLADCIRKEKDVVYVSNANYHLLRESFEKSLEDYTFVDTLTEKINNGEKLFKTIAPTTVSKLETFYKCPCLHYFNYGLKIHPREIAELNVQDFGTILHEVLQLYIVKMKKDEDDHATREAAKKCFRRVAERDEYKSIVNDVRTKSIVELLKKESEELCLAVKNQLKNSQFINYEAELKFGSNQVKAIEIPNGKETIKLVGTIDRVDVCRDYFIIIDYKSGKYGADYSESALYSGQKLQLLIYLMAMKDNLNKEPVGFYYMRLHNAFMEENKERYTFVGRTIADDKVISKIDVNYDQTKQSKLLGIKQNQDGSYNAYSQVITREQLADQVEYAKLSIINADKLIKSGYVEENPADQKNTCKICDYADICGAADLFANIGRKKPSGITPEIISNVINKKGGKSE